MPVDAADSILEKAVLGTDRLSTHAVFVPRGSIIESKCVATTTPGVTGLQWGDPLPDGVLCDINVRNILGLNRPCLGVVRKLVARDNDV